MPIHKTHKTKPNARNQRLTVALSKYELKMIGDLASKLNVPKPNVIRCAIAYYMLHFDEATKEGVDNMNRELPPGFKLEPEYIKHPDGSITFTGFGLVRDQSECDIKCEEESED